MHCFRQEKKKRNKKKEGKKKVKDEHYSGFIRTLRCFIAVTNEETTSVIKLMKIKLFTVSLQILSVVFLKDM